MSYSRISRWIAIPAIAMAVAATAFGADSSPKSSSGGLLGVSKPSKEVTLSFDHPGLVAKIFLKEGEPVTADQLVAKQDDEEEQAALLIDKDKAEDKTSVEAEVAVRDDKEVQYERMKAKGDAMGQTEVDAARMEVVVADARIKLANHTHTQDVLKYNQTQIAVKKLELHCKIDGVVAETMLHEGEAASSNTPVMRVIQVDPLWVEVPVPIIQANRLKMDDTAAVSFSDKTRIGKIVFIKPYDDSGSQRRVIRLEVPNPEKLQPGEIVTVDFAGTGLAKN